MSSGKKCENATKNSVQQNTACLEQKNYASQEYFRQPLVVMVEVFIRSGVAGAVLQTPLLFNN